MSTAHGWIDGWSNRHSIRLILVAEVSVDPDPDETFVPIGEALGFGRLREHVLSHKEIFPSRVGDARTGAAEWKLAAGFVQTRRFVESLWAMPDSSSDLRYLVQLIDVELPQSVEGEVDMLALIPALEDMYTGALPTAFSGITPEALARRHLIVILPGSADNDDLDPDIMQKLIYRADLPVREEYSSICRPPELNRRPGRGAALGPFVSVLWGQQDYIENCAFLSVLCATTAASVVSQGRHDVLREIDELSRGLAQLDGGHRSIADIRERLERVNRFIARTQNRLARSIDGLSTLMPYVPALRAEGYHRALFQSLDAESNRVALERLLARLTELIRVEQDLLAARLTLDTEARNRRWTISIGAASLIAIPFGVIFGFFGVGASEVDPHASMFSPRYLPLFVLVLGFTVAIAVVHYGLYRRHRQQMRAASSRAQRQR